MRQNEQRKEVEQPEFEERVVKINRVTKVVKGGRRFRFAALVVIGAVKTTIPHEVTGVYGAGRVILKPASEGTGVIAGGPVRAVVELAGISDILSKSLGSATPINVVRATIEGLKSLETVEEVAARRGKTVAEILG